MGPSSFLRLLLLVAVLRVFATETSQTTRDFNIEDFGAVADGQTDSSKALLSAWNEGCESAGTSRIYVPAGTFKVHPVVFSGPCNGPMVLRVEGLVKAPASDGNSESDGWIEFQYINGLVVTGKGIFDGQGQSVWTQNTCSSDHNCKLFPTSIRFSFVNNATIEGITSLNSKSKHIGIFGSKNMELRYLKIQAPADSPNTDGIYTSLSHNISIYRSVIATGDDCVAVGPGSINVTVQGVFCGPGHGISVGSLGRQPREPDVVGLNVTNCTFTNTDNGVRIKTWPSTPAHNKAADINFQDLIMDHVYNPILIDQQYCPHDQCSLQSPSRVKITDVTYKNIRGTSTSKNAVILQCSEAVPCEDVKLVDINLDYTGPEEGPSQASCEYANGEASGEQNPPSCL